MYLRINLSWEHEVAPSSLLNTEISGHPLVKDCQFGVSPVNYSDSDSDSEYFVKTNIYLLYNKTSYSNSRDALTLVLVYH